MSVPTFITAWEYELYINRTFFALPSVSNNAHRDYHHTRHLQRQTLSASHLTVASPLLTMCTVIYYERLCYCGKDMGSTQEWDCCAEGTQFNGWRHCNVAIRSAGRFVPMECPACRRRREDMARKVKEVKKQGKVKNG